MPKRFKGWRMEKKNTTAICYREASGRSLEYFITYKMNPSAHMCDMRRRHSEIDGFLSPLHIMIRSGMLWRHCPIIRLGLICRGITWDLSCGLPEPQFCMWHWANTWDQLYQCNGLLWTDIMKIRPIRWKWTERASFSSYFRDLTGKRAQ